jgi:hypothetical protein
MCEARVIETVLVGHRRRVGMRAQEEGWNEAAFYAFYAWWIH